MSTAAPIPIPSDVVTLTGPFLISGLINWALFGALVVQVYYYYYSFPNDSWKVKALVWTSMIIQTVQTGLSTRDEFRILGRHWGSMDELDKIGWQWLSSPAFTAITELYSQLFYAWRIWILSRKQPYVPCIIVVLSFLQCGSSLAVGGQLGLAGRFSELQDHYHSTITVWLVSSAACDLLIAVAMAWYLRRSRTGFRRTDAILTKLLRLTVECGMILAVFAVLDLTLFLVFSYNNIHIPVCSALAKLYCIGLLMVLNSRIKIVGGRGCWEDDMTLSLPSSSSPGRSDNSLRFALPAAAAHAGENAVDISEKSHSDSSSTLEMENPMRKNNSSLSYDGDSTNAAKGVVILQGVRVESDV